MRKIAHIVNPFKAPKGSELSKAQPKVFESMRRAQKFADEIVEVELFSAQYEEDRDFVPECFTKTKNLTRSIMDLVKASPPRKLPILKDILDRLYEESDAEYFIYSNVDIGVMPHFYTLVDTLIERGHKAFTITRRTINKKFASEPLDVIYSQIGGKHPGHDCFIFRRESYPKYKIGNMCIGIPHIGKILTVNFDGIDKECTFFNELHATFHVGNFGQWMADRKTNANSYKPYQQHNQSLLHRACKQLNVNIRKG